MRNVGSRIGWILGVVTVAAGLWAMPAETHAAPQAWSLALDKAVKEKPLNILVAAKDGKCTQAFGIASTYNKALHDVDASALKITDAGLSGAVKVTINADAWVPPDKKPVACEFKVEVSAQDGKLSGTYQGKFGESDVKGSVSGTLQATPAERKSAKIEFLMNDALAAGQPHLRRANVALNVGDGKIGGGTIACFDSFHWTGKIESVNLQLTAEGFTGDMKTSISSGTQGQVTSGAYTYAIDGKIVGNTVGGTFRVKLGDKDLRTGTLFGAVK